MELPPPAGMLRFGFAVAPPLGDCAPSDFGSLAAERRAEGLDRALSTVFVYGFVILCLDTRAEHAPLHLPLGNTPGGGFHLFVFITAAFGLELLFDLSDDFVEDFVTLFGSDLSALDRFGDFIRGGFGGGLSHGVFCFTGTVTGFPAPFTVFKTGLGGVPPRTGEFGAECVFLFVAHRFEGSGFDSLPGEKFLKRHSSGTSIVLKLCQEGSRLRVACLCNERPLREVSVSDDVDRPAERPAVDLDGFAGAVVLDVVVPDPLDPDGRFERNRAAAEVRLDRFRVGRPSDHGLAVDIRPPFLILFEFDVFEPPGDPVRLMVDQRGRVAVELERFDVRNRRTVEPVDVAFTAAV